MLPSSTLHGLGNKERGPFKSGHHHQLRLRCLWRVPASLAVSYWITANPEVIPSGRESAPPHLI